MMVQQGVAVSPDGIKSDVAEIQKARQTDDDVQTQAQHHIDQGSCHDVRLVTGKEKGKGDREQGAGGQDRSVDMGFRQKLPAAFHPAEEPAPDEGEEEGADSYDRHVSPAPLHDLFNRIDPDHHDRKGQEHEPERNDQRFFEF